MTGVLCVWWGSARRLSVVKFRLFRSGYELLKWVVLSCNLKRDVPVILLGCKSSHHPITLQQKGHESSLMRMTG